MEKYEKCQRFFDNLRILLWDSYNVIESCNADLSAYLVPAGTENEVTYRGKPVNSFRISDHWNWYANVNKCEDPLYIQCHSIDVIEPLPRPKEGKPSEARRAIQVAIYSKDGKYHCVYGEKFDRRKRRWTWIETNPSDVVALLN